MSVLNGIQLQSAELRAFREGMRVEFAKFRVDMLKESAATQKQIAELATGLQKVRSDLLTWSFVFWVGAVGAIAGLTGILR